MSEQSLNPSADPAWDVVRAYLDGLKRPVIEEIRRYPPPVAGCDEQYGHLMEKRDALARELRRLDAAAREGRTGAVGAFIDESPVIDADAARTLKDRLEL